MSLVYRSTVPYHYATITVNSMFILNLPRLRFKCIVSFCYACCFYYYFAYIFRTSSYTNAQTTAATNYMMLAEPVLAQSGYRGQIQQPKYPPPLIPVRHLNGGLRYDGPQYGQALDAVDLSAAPKYVYKITSD